LTTTAAKRPQNPILRATAPPRHAPACASLRPPCHATQRLVRNHACCPPGTASEGRLTILAGLPRDRGELDGGRAHQAAQRGEEPAARRCWRAARTPGVGVGAGYRRRRAGLRTG